MRRLFWLGAGIVAGVAIARKANAAAQAATPAGIAGNVSTALSELAGAIGTFGADVRAGMTERENELSEEVRERTGIDPRPRQALTAAQDSLRGSTARPPRGGHSGGSGRDTRARRAGG
jgi:hypothetical protein